MMMRPIVQFVMVLLVFCLYPLSASAWNYIGHVVIAQVAYDHLNPVAKHKADNLATLIFNQLPTWEQDKLDRNFSDASTFAKVAMLPDTWRKWRLATIFSDFDAPLPLNLIPFGNENTQQWH